MLRPRPDLMNFGFSGNDIPGRMPPSKLRKVAERTGLEPATPGVTGLSAVYNVC